MGGLRGLDRGRPRKGPGNCYAATGEPPAWSVMIPSKRPEPLQRECVRIPAQVLKRGIGKGPSLPLLRWPGPEWVVAHLATLVPATRERAKLKGRWPKIRRGRGPSPLHSKKTYEAPRRSRASAMTPDTASARANNEETG